jgi:hypothetical protein
MLLKNRISKIQILSDEWRTARLGKFTSSKIISLMADKEYSSGFMSYIYQKVGEELTGVSVDEEDAVETEAMRWGLFYESEALQKFGKLKGLEFLIVQQLITVPDTRFGSTPDGLVVHNESTDGTAYNVSTVEVKCFPTYTRYISLALTKTPADVRKVNSTVYWQVIDQMDNCDSLIGYLVVYHPKFKAGNLNVVEFKKSALLDDFRFLKERKRMATEKFEEVREKLISLGAY